VKLKEDYKLLTEVHDWVVHSRPRDVHVRPVRLPTMPQQTMSSDISLN